VSTYNSPLRFGSAGGYFHSSVIALVAWSPEKSVMSSSPSALQLDVSHAGSNVPMDHGIVRFRRFPA